MVLALLLCFSQCTSVENRNVIGQNRKFQNHWEYGGYSYFKDGKLVLVPGDRLSKGYIWCTSRLPVTNWSSTSTFSFQNDSNFNQFGIWITSNYGQVGDVFGGPSKFSGISVLCRFQDGILKIEVRQNDGTLSFLPIHFYPEHEFRLIKPKVSIQITATLNIVKINLKHDNKETIIFDDQPLVNPSHFWFGITSFNSQDGSPLIVNSVKLTGMKERLRDDEIVKQKSSNNTALITLNQLLHSNQTINVSQVIESVELLSNHSRSLAGSRSVILLFHEKLFGFADAWTRRSVIIKNQEKNIQQTLHYSLFEVEQFVYDFSNNVEDEMQKFQRKVSEIEIDVANELRESMIDGKAEEIEKSDLLPKILLATAFVECVLAIVFVNKLFLC
ncbi:putative vesicular mannose-binding lectin [Histomonas meleagridis]|uniref:putative vesicular mannose-binding lectin n=1 Tax=Histomonas meleagridis TaxID=135588 RepID=UPI0035599F68|nr:putative vesicular mannose-binding lectin [Histomonas meleagridis]KAH0799174.1 putative vesicular mannose-binding lectin [Histomonas meleagridis]